MWLSISKIIFQIGSADPEKTPTNSQTLPIYNISIDDISRPLIKNKHGSEI